MHIDLFTLLPGVCWPYLNESMLKKAQTVSALSVAVHNLRDDAPGKHQLTDDLPYGGGGGMVMKPEPIFNAVERVLGAPPTVPVILLTPQGRVFDQRVAAELAQHPHLALVCGRYEGFDERVRTHLATDEISIGDFVLTGGELPALALIDAVARLLPGVLGDPTGTQDDSHASGRLEYPHYTRPPEFRGWRVPEILLSGHHAHITQWRRREALRRTWQRRPDMLQRFPPTPEEARWLAEWQAENHHE